MAGAELHREIDLVSLEVDRCNDVADVQLDVRIVDIEGRQPRYKPFGREGRIDSDLERLGLACRAQAGRCLIDDAQRRGDLALILLTRRGEAQSRSVALEQTNAEDSLAS
jgi:hypothetical protein